MTRVKDLVGKKYKNFYIHDYKRENNRTFVLAECPFCHEKKWMRKDSLDVEGVVSCGCYNAENNYLKAKDIKDKKFGYLIPKEPTNDRNSNGSIMWKCDCTNCNKECFVSVECLEKGVISCGCVQEESRRKNGVKVGAFVKEAHCIDGTNVKNLTQKISKRNTSGIKGVYLDRNRSKWCAQIKFKGKNYYLGRYEKKEDAAEVRKIAEEKIFGDFLKWYKENMEEKINTNVEGQEFEESKENEKVKEKTSKKQGGKIKGVTYVKNRNKYRAEIRYEKKRYSLGCYEKLEDAILIRIEAEKQIHGNFIEWYNEKIKSKYLKKKEESKIHFKNGQIIGSWEVIEPVEGKVGNYYKCKCINCGNESELIARYIKRKPQIGCKNCGNIDLTGKVFGNVKVIERKSGNRTNTMWLCECLLCGKKWEVLQLSLTSGNTKSCGCVRRKNSQKTGITGVTYHEESKKYRAQIGFNGKIYYLGYHEKLEDAAEARKQAEKEKEGDFLLWYAENYKKQWERLNRKKG